MSRSTVRGISRRVAADTRGVLLRPGGQSAQPGVWHLGGREAVVHVQLERPGGDLVDAEQAAVVGLAGHNDLHPGQRDAFLGGAHGERGGRAAADGHAEEGSRSGPGVGAAELRGHVGHDGVAEGVGRAAAEPLLEHDGRGSVGHAAVLGVGTQVGGGGVDGAGHSWCRHWAPLTARPARVVGWLALLHLEAPPVLRRPGLPGAAWATVE
jgi:hypothetical protein